MTQPASQIGALAKLGEIELTTLLPLANVPVRVASTNAPAPEWLPAAPDALVTPVPSTVPAPPPPPYPARAVAFL